MAVLLIILLIVISPFLRAAFNQTPLLTLMLPLSWMLGAFGSLWLFRTDLNHPTDQPIRFNRATRKVYVYHMKEHYNPFGKWLPEIKTFDWDTLEAQITKTLVVTGRSVGARYNLEIVQVSPDNPNQIVERSFALEPNNPLGNNFDDKWSFVCNFMERGTAHLPPVVLRSKEVEFWRTVFDSTPFIAPGEYGRTSRRELLNLKFNSIKNIVFTLAMLFLVFFSVIAAPFILTLGLCGYIALKNAPAPHWPDDIAGPKLI